MVHKCRAEKKSSPKKLRTTAEDSPEYWEERLRLCGLTMDDGRRNFIDYGYTLEELDFVQTQGNSVDIEPGE